MMLGDHGFLFSNGPPTLLLYHLDIAVGIFMGFLYKDQPDNNVTSE